MTSGVAGLVQAYAPADVRDVLLAGLRAADVADAVDGSMFLTERDGGSDLGRTVHCVARDVGDGRVEITARSGSAPTWTGPPSCCWPGPRARPTAPRAWACTWCHGCWRTARPTATPSAGSSRSWHPQRPHREVELHGALGYALRSAARPAAPPSSDSGGLGRMMEMVNGSRFGVALMGLGIARRCFAEAAAWAHHRQAKGRALVDLPLVREQMVDLQAELEAARPSASSARPRPATGTGPGCGASWCPRPRSGCAAWAWRPPRSRSSCTVATATARTGASPASSATPSATPSGRAARTSASWTCCGRSAATRPTRPSWPGWTRPSRSRRPAGPAGWPRRSTPWPRPAPSWSTGSAGLGAREPDAAEAVSARLCDLLVRTTAAALLLEQAGEGGDLAAHKALVALRYTRRHLDTGSTWSDNIAAVAGRDLLAYADLDPRHRGQGGRLGAGHAPRMSERWTLSEESEAVSPATVTLVEGASFTICDRGGEIAGRGVEGLYVGDTRICSRLVLTVDDRPVEPLTVAALSPVLGLVRGPDPRSGAPGLPGRVGRSGHVRRCPAAQPGQGTAGRWSCDCPSAPTWPTCWTSSGAGRSPRRCSWPWLTARPRSRTSTASEAS
jgi:hypothetical protein